MFLRQWGHKEFCEGGSKGALVLLGVACMLELGWDWAADAWQWRQSHLNAAFIRLPVTKHPKR